MTGLVMELSHLFSILSDRSLEVMLAELVIRKKNLQNSLAIASPVPELLLFLILGSVPCSSVLSALMERQ